MKKFYSILFGLLLLFTMSGGAMAIYVIPNIDGKGTPYTGLDLNNADGVTWTNPTPTSVTFSLTGPDPGILNWNNYIVNPDITVNYNNGPFINNVTGLTNINGTINGLNANVFLNSLGGAIIGSKADINLGYGVISTLPLKETDITALRADIKTGKELEYAVGDPSSKYRFGIFVEDNAAIKFTNKLQLVTSIVVLRTDKTVANPAGRRVQLPSSNGGWTEVVAGHNNMVYTTTDGIVFKLDSTGAVASIASSTPVPGGKAAPINSRWYYTPYPSNPPPDGPDPNSPDPLFLNRLQEYKEYTPTSFNPDINNEISLNLGGTFMQVAPLDTTSIANNLDTNSFPRSSVGVIAMNDSANHILPDSMIAVNEFTPVGAASQVGNSGLKPIGAASQVDNDDNYDFVIPQAIVE